MFVFFSLKNSIIKLERVCRHLFYFAPFLRFSVSPFRKSPFLRFIVSPSLSLSRFSVSPIHLSLRFSVSPFRKSPFRRFAVSPILLLWALTILISLPASAADQELPGSQFMADIEKFASFEDRSTGTPGCNSAAAYIKEQFKQLGIDTVGSHLFNLPVRRHKGSRLIVPQKNFTVPVRPFFLNAISPQTILSRGLEGPLVYVGLGELHHFNGKQIQGSIVLMDIDSSKNWIHAASLGAKALIYLDGDATPKMLFEDKMELSPVHFPRFRMQRSEARKVFGPFETAPAGLIFQNIRLHSDTTWQQVQGENIYGLISGTDPDLRDELVIVEAFYDSTVFVPGLSPGADEAVSIATLLKLARVFIRQPPGRSVLLVATAGHAQTLAGMREMIWSIRFRSKDMRRLGKDLKATVKHTRKVLSLLDDAGKRGVSSFRAAAISEEDATADLLLDAVSERLKTEVDSISRRLMRLRLDTTGDKNQEIIDNLVQERTVLRRLGWKTNLTDISDEELKAIERLIPPSIEEYTRILADAGKQLKTLKSARRFRNLAKSAEIAAVVSLHLSSHGDGFGAFNYGWLHSLRSRVNRTPAYSTLEEALRESASSLKDVSEGPVLYRDTLRPSRKRSWQSYFLDRPPLGGEVSALAGYIGFTLVTVNDARPRWGTPSDLPNNINRQFAANQSTQIAALVNLLTKAPRLHHGQFPRNGFTNVSGKAKFLRHGELFPDQPAPGMVIMAFQGPGRYYSMVDSMGKFYLKGVATKKLVRDKVIIEGYKFDPDTGAVTWAIEKKQTGKPAYRLKIERSNVETTLVIFGCKQTSIFNLLEPRSFRYMTKIQLIDGRREAKPARYWWSRIDTRSSIIASMYLEPGTRMKMTLSDTVLQKKMILLNADDKRPDGVGYLVDDWPNLIHTDYRVARDMWALLGPRIENLEKHGIYNERISQLRQQGVAALNAAAKALQDKVYDRFAEAATRSWALASRVYNDVEKTQKDVLFGVLFYIALFVPFAFCMERLIFSYSNIHKRIIAFCGILLLLIAVIYNVHPAFKLAYSPTVVILAFFIMGLSLIVTLIIYFRFEEEMTKLQRRAMQKKAAEIGRWKAFVAAFLLGVSNLRRRRLRTVLTCTTLIILTFTVMSFTSVKSMRHRTRLLLQEQSPYLGYLYKNFNWKDLPAEALAIISNHFEGKGTAAPRVWLEDQDPTRALNVPVRLKNRVYEAGGVIGLSADEVEVTGLDRILIGGRWFYPDERRVVLLPERMARDLGIDPGRLEDISVLLWGMPFQVVGVFSGKALMERADLDGEPLTPVIFPSEVTMEMSEVELEAMESGEDVRSFQSRYQHISGDLTVIIPYQSLMAAGGHFKAVAIRPEAGLVNRSTAENLVDRFALTLFAGEPDGIYIYQASDTMSYSGVPNVVIPLIISVFIVLNTMIGSVYERKHEIGIYTSVGLAPSHVSFLFIAEALAFAVLSVVLGYLLAQVTASFFAGTALWSGITVNYSSMAGVAAMVLVILVVLISVIYPSRVAAEIAIPDVNRSWKLPEAVGNRIDLELPFLMNYREHLSVGGYLLEHFEGHQDVSHGLFSAGELNFRLAKCRESGTEQPVKPAGEAIAEDLLQFFVHIWLAPFDFGITQNVEIAFCAATGDPGSIEIQVRLERLAGEANAWRRINKAFLDDLRKQLLIWRSLDDTLKAQYEKLMVDRGEKQAISLTQFERNG